MSNKTNIEEDIKNIKEYIDNWCDSLTDEDGYGSELDEDSKQFIQEIENILADRERLEKENEELLEAKISASTNNIISNLQKELNEENNRCAKFAVENNELQIKAKKYDNLIEKIKEIINNLEKRDIYKLFEDILIDLQKILKTEQEKK